MSRLVALEWDGREARVVVGRRRGKDLLVEQAFALDLGPREAGQAAAEPQIGARLAAALAERKIGRADALVAVGRTGIELRLLNAPPAPDDELPDLVRFQAVRQFSALGEDWPLDFVKLSSGEDGGTSVLAAAMSPELVGQIKATCEGAQITPTNLVLRPFSAASLVVRRAPDVGCRLIVDLLTDEADLTVLDGSQVVFIRTVRVPVSGDAESFARLLLGEIRRTMVAAQNQLRGRAVDRIVLCGDERGHAVLKAKLEQDLSLPVVVFDPFAAVELAWELKSAPPENSGRFTPLLGMLCDEAAGVGHAIDFLHPRKRPPPPDLRRRNILAAATAAVAVLAVVAVVWLLLSSLDSQIRELTQKLDKQKKLVDEVVKSEKAVAEIDRWTATDVVWLEELHRLSLAEKEAVFPPAEEAIVTQFVGIAQPAGGGVLTVDGKLKNEADIATMEQKLRDKRHDVSGGNISEDKSDVYAWRFKESVTIKNPADAKKTAAAPTSARTAARAAGGAKP